jgi:peptide/nickel transport system substrate-binding protein
MNIKHLLLVFAAALLLAACQPGGGNVTIIPGTPEGSAGEIATNQPPVTTMEPLPEEPTSQVMEPVSADILLDPALAEDEDSLMVATYIYEGLIKINMGVAEGALAEDWDVSEDELDYIFYLRPDVVFHDGTPLTADVVLDNFNRWFDPEHPLHGSGAYTAWQTEFLGFKGEVGDDGRPVSFFDGIEKINDLTVLIHLNEPNPDLLNKLAMVPFSIASTTALASAGDAYGTAEGAPAGTGLYQVSEWGGDTLILAPFEDAWSETPELPIEFPLE